MLHLFSIMTLRHEPFSCGVYNVYFEILAKWQYYIGDTGTKVLKYVDFTDTSFSSYHNINRTNLALLGLVWKQASTLFFF